MHANHEAKAHLSACRVKSKPEMSTKEDLHINGHVESHNSRTGLVKGPKPKRPDSQERVTVDQNLTQTAFKFNKAVKVR